MTPLTGDWIVLHRRGGVCMGMLRFDQRSKLFANERDLDDNKATFRSRWAANLRLTGLRRAYILEHV
jgi:hypothetical protein